MEKIKVSSDTLYQYLTEHNFILSVLSKMMGVSNGILMGCFRHDLNRLGKPMSFSVSNIERLNAVLEKVADELRQCILTFGSPQTFTNQHGSTYDPSLIEQIKQGIGRYFKLRGLTERLLGWNRAKWNFILSAPSSKIYGNITQEDVNRINAELLSVAGVLSSYQVVSDDNKVNQPENKKDIRHNHLSSVSGGVSDWDDTSLDLWERYDRFHCLFPDGLIAFTVNDGFTVCEDDARLLARIDTTLKPYTDIATGRTTIWMDAAKWKQMRCAFDDEFVAVAPMYAE